MDELKQKVRYRMSPKDWSHSLRMIRHAKCITADKLSKLTGLGRWVISRSENSSTTYPNVRCLFAYADVLKLDSVDDVIDLARELKKHKNLEDLINIKRVIDESRKKENSGEDY